MAKFMLIKISLMAEITDADALREAALKKFDTTEITSDDHPDTADWHASEEGQEERRQIATHDRDALSQFVNPFKACELLDREMFDGVPGIKVVPLGSHAAVSGGLLGGLCAVGVSWLPATADRAQDDLDGASVGWISNSPRPAPSAREPSTSATAWRASRRDRAGR
jgi:hypothetical protein